MKKLSDKGSFPQLSTQPAIYPAIARPTAFGAAVALLVLLGVTAAVQSLAGVYRGEAGHQPDEAAHFMTGVMLRDYAVSGFHARPFEYAKEHYLHYPKSALGMFPPLFHALLGTWLLFSSGTFAGGLAFMALITACVAWQIRQMLALEYGVWVAGITGGILIFLPLVRELTSEVMIDSLVALFALAVVRYTARFLNSGVTRDAVWLGIFAAAGCLAKGNGMGALLCPALAIVFTGRYRLLRRPGLYIAALIVLVIGAPFEWMSLKFYQKNVSFLPGGLAFTKSAADFYLRALWAGGGVIMLFAAAGMILKALEWYRKKDIDTLWPSLFALLAGTMVFHIVLPQVPNQRYMITAIAAAVFFLPALFQTLRKPMQAAALLALATLAAATGPGYLTPLGFHAAAEWLEQQPDYSKALIVSETLGEGAFVCEIASLDGRRRPDHYAVRATKLLARSDWNSSYYSVRFKTPSEALHRVEDLGIRYVVLDLTPDIERKAHQAQMEEAILKSPDRVSLMAHFPATDRQRARSLYIYRLNYAAAVPLVPLTYSLDSTLGYEISQPEGR
jgi:hypothetical protein